MTSAAAPFDYSNLSERPPGRLLSAAARLLPGIRAVQDQVPGFAEGWRQANLLAVQQPGPLWVVLGDSMSQGIGAPAYDRGWVGQLAGRLRHHARPGDAQPHDNQPYRVVNLSFTGARVADVLNRQLPAMAALGVHPDLVTLLIGSNDIFNRELRREAPAAFEQLLQQIPDGTVVANLPNPTPEVRAINAAIERAAGTGRVVVADMRPHTLRAWRGKLAADWFHPNERGYRLIADTFATAIEAAPK